ncbi:peptide ABC transporter substrate-binding protein [Aminobacter sp. AP02]|uniref:peptide ABC transporter substrate-binding protein n=1 Tax=Aminobacter sp. AP02 TaxID=2135737 RepID=UPI000D7B38C2|nr:peptide ABC transporter substrate-binding protein [Aminobacter sp. AP02]PWK68524.1 oligopeptide transport system substrate-binding protein [Aminobacter sp. AP02]
MRNRIASWLSAFILIPMLLTDAALAATIDIQTSAEPATLDPQKLTGDWPDLIVGDLFEGLVTEDPSGNPVAGQAASWKVSADGLTYTFKLRDGLKWSDGEPLQASDFLFGLRRLLDPKTKAEFAFIQFPVKNAEAFNNGIVTDPAALGMAAPDAKTLEIKLERPMPYFLQALVQASAYPVPQHIIEKFGDDWAKPEHLVGNGAFKLAEWKPGKTLRAVKNDNYRAADEVEVDEVVYHILADEAATLAAYEAGDFGIATQFPALEMKRLETSRPGEARITPTLGIWYYVLNMKTPPFNDPQLRRALSMAIDREQLGAGVLETGQAAAYGMVPPGVPGFGATPYAPDWRVKSYEQRVAEAAALMQSAGYGPDKPLKFQLRTSDLPPQIKVSEAVAAAWKGIGAEAEFVRAPIPEHQSALNRHDFAGGSTRWILDYSDAADSLALMKTGHPNNYPSYSNPAFDRLLELAATEQDAAERAALLRAAERLALDETAVIPLTWAVSKNLVSPKVAGFEDNVRNVHRSRWLALKE